MLLVTKRSRMKNDDLAVFRLNYRLKTKENVAVKVLWSLAVGLFLLTSASFAYQVWNPATAHADYYGCDGGEDAYFECASSFGACTNDFEYCVSLVCGDGECFCDALQHCGDDCTNC